MIGGLLSLGRGIAGATGRVAANTGKIAGTGALGLGGALMGGAVGATTGAIGAIKGTGVIGAAKDNVINAGKTMAAPVTKLAETDLVNKKETDLLEEIAKNTGETADNTDKVNPKSSGGQADPLKSEEEVKKGFADSRAMSGLTKAIGGLSATTVGLGVALAKLISMRDPSDPSGSGEDTRSNAAKAMDNLRIPSAAETKEAITDQMADGSGAASAALIGAGATGMAANKISGGKLNDALKTPTQTTPKGTKLDSAGRLRDAKGQFVKQTAKKTGARQILRTGAIQGAKLAARVATGPVGLAVGVGMGAYDVTRGVMAATGADDVVAGVGADLQEARFKKKQAKEATERREQMTSEFQNIVEDIQDSDIPDDRKQGYVQALSKAINVDNKPMFDIVKKELMDEMMGGEAKANLDAINSSEALNPKVSPKVAAAPTQIADTVETEVSNMNEAEIQASKSASIPAPAPTPPAPAPQQQDNIATTITVDRKAKDSTAEELKKIDSIRMPAGF